MLGQVHQVVRDCWTVALWAYTLSGACCYPYVDCFAAAVAAAGVVVVVVAKDLVFVLTCVEH